MQSRKLADVCYDIRGPVLEEAKRLEDEGRRIIKLNIGNPAPFGFDAPEEILLDVIRHLPTAQGYSDSQGLMSARTAVVQHYQSQGIDITDVDDIWLGNGVSELISMALQAMLDNGDEVLVPAPDYPLWTASTSLAGGRPVHYLCDETDDWLPDLDDLAAKITPRTKAIVVINPNNPTGAVYPRSVLEQIADLARQHGLVDSGRRDLRQDPLRRRGAPHVRLGRAGRLHADLQRAVEGVPAGRFPLGLADGHRPEETRQQLPRGSDDPGQHAAVRECASPARDPDRARRPAEHQGPGAARWSIARSSATRR